MAREFQTKALAPRRGVKDDAIECEPEKVAAKTSHLAAEEAEPIAEAPGASEREGLEA